MSLQRNPRGFPELRKTQEHKKIHPSFFEKKVSNFFLSPKTSKIYCIDELETRFDVFVNLFPSYLKQKAQKQRKNWSLAATQKYVEFEEYWLSCSHSRGKSHCAGSGYKQFASEIFFRCFISAQWKILPHVILA